MGTIAIVRKDLAAHTWAVFPGAAAVLVLGLGLVVRAALGDGDVLSAFRWFVLVGISAWTWLLLDRLVSDEFGAHGWEVMAALPISPRRVLTAKLTIVAGLVGTAILGGWLVCISASVSPFIPDVTDEAALGALLGALAYAALALGVLLALALCGRLRAWAHAGGAAALLLLVGAGVDPATLPGLRCVLPGARLPALAAAGAAFELALASALLVAALVAVGWGGGRLARRLQGRPAWTGRALTLLVLGALAGPALPWAAPTSAWGATPGWRPRDVGSGAAAAGGARAGEQSSGSVAWFPLPTAGGALRVPLRDPAAAGAAAARSGELAAALALLPCLGLEARTLTLEHDPAWGPLACEPGLNAAGPLLRADVAQAAPNLLGARGAELDLDLASEGRLRVGPWRLLLEGLPGWWTGRWTPDALGSSDERAAAWALDALERRGPSWGEGVLARWDVVARVAGPEPARALGAWTLAQLTRRVGAPAVLRFARAACARRQAPGLGVGLDPSGFAALCVEHLGATPAALERDLRADARALRDRAAAFLSALPRPEETRLTVDARGRLVFAASAPAGRSGRVALLHGRAGWLDDAGGAPPRALREEVDLGAAPARTLRTYPSGARVRYAFALPAPDLGCDLLLGWEEVVIP